MTNRCRRGLHELTCANTKWDTNGRRRCLPCRRAAARARAAMRGRTPVEVAADRRIERAIGLAQRVVGAVREHDRDLLAELVDGADWPALLVALAALVPDDRTPGELLAWNADRTSAA